MPLPWGSKTLGARAKCSDARWRPYSGSQMFTGSCCADVKGINAQSWSIMHIIYIITDKSWITQKNWNISSVSSVSERSRTLGVCGTELHWNLRGLLFSHYASWPWMDVSCGSVVWGATLVPWQNANQAHQSSENEKIGKHALKKTQEKTQQKIQRLLVFFQLEAGFRVWSDLPDSFGPQSEFCIIIILDSFKSFT